MNLLYTYGMYYKKPDGQLQKKEGRKIPPPPFRISTILMMVPTRDGVLVYLLVR